MKKAGYNISIAGKELLTVIVDGRNYMDESGRFTKSHKKAVKFHTCRDAIAFIDGHFNGATPEAIPAI